MRLRSSAPAVLLGLAGGLLGLPAVSQEAPAPAEPASRQAPVETFTGETTVTIVEVPAQVVQDGQPVTGLGPEDFRLYDDGEPRETRSVETVDLRPGGGRDDPRPAGGRAQPSAMLVPP